jgi:hypothetical protein
MKTFDAITGYTPHAYEGRIITFGLTEEENSCLKILLHNKNFEIYTTDIASDLVALLATAIIVNATKLEVNDFNILENYYTEVGEDAAETVFWIGSPLPPLYLQRIFKCHNKFDDIVPEIKKVLSKTL